MRIVNFIVLLLFLACVDTDQIEQDWIEKKVENKINNFVYNKNNDCLESLMQKILQDADSIMLKDAFLDIPDSLVVPTKRYRPDAPEVEFPDFESPKNPVNSKKDSI